MRKRAGWFGMIGFTLLIVAGTASPLMGQDFAIISQKDIFHPVMAKNGMVATQDHYATQAGLEVLKEGGNAVDAAVTVAFTLAVILPRANLPRKQLFGNPEWFKPREAGRCRAISISIISMQSYPWAIG